ncbi:MAG: hypothetical protein AAGK78_00975, partial [Planctomycetota bacterium]
MQRFRRSFAFLTGSVLALAVGFLFAFASSNQQQAVAETVAVDGEAKPTAFIGATILTAAGEPIEGGTLLVEGGKIIAVGVDVEVPADARQIDVTGKVIMPGMVDTHSHVGGVGGADSASPTQPQVRVYDSLDVRDDGFRKALAGGVTTLNIMSGSGHLMSGQTVYLKNRPGAKSIEDLLLYTEDGRVAGGMKMANGTNPQGRPPFPGTRGKA